MRPTRYSKEEKGLCACASSWWVDKGCLRRKNERQITKWSERL